MSHRFGGDRRRAQTPVGTDPGQHGQTIVGVPPFGHTTHLRVFIDPDLLERGTRWWTPSAADGQSYTRRMEQYGGTVVELGRC